MYALILLLAVAQAEVKPGDLLGDVLLGDLLDLLEEPDTTQRAMLIPGGRHIPERIPYELRCLRLFDATTFSNGRCASVMPEDCSNVITKSIDKTWYGSALSVCYGTINCPCQGDGNCKCLGYSSLKVFDIHHDTDDICFDGGMKCNMKRGHRHPQTCSYPLLSAFFLRIVPCSGKYNYRATIIYPNIYSVMANGTHYRLVMNHCIRNYYRFDEKDFHEHFTVTQIDWGQVCVRAPRYYGGTCPDVATFTSIESMKKYIDSKILYRVTFGNVFERNWAWIHTTDSVPVPTAHYYPASNDKCLEIDTNGSPTAVRSSVACNVSLSRDAPETRIICQHVHKSYVPTLPFFSIVTNILNIIEPFVVSFVSALLKAIITLLLKTFGDIVSTLEKNHALTEVVVGVSQLVITTITHDWTSAIVLMFASFVLYSLKVSNYFIISAILIILSIFTKYEPDYAYRKITQTFGRTYRRRPEYSDSEESYTGRRDSITDTDTDEEGQAF